MKSQSHVLCKGDVVQQRVDADVLHPRHNALAARRVLLGGKGRVRVARRLQMDVPQPKPRYTFRPPALAVRPRGAHCSSLKHAPIHLWAHLKRELRREDEGEGEQVLDEWGHTTAAGQRGVECLLEFR